jgi:hypothetical protein
MIKSIETTCATCLLATIAWMSAAKAENAHYRSSILPKLGASDRKQAFSIALQHHLVDDV